MRKHLAEVCDVTKVRTRPMLGDTASNQQSQWVFEGRTHCYETETAVKAT